jgi:hypothetical protein
MKRFLILAWLAPLAASAHDGHGHHGAHWHATDAWGFVALAIVLGAAVWLARRK